MPFVSITRLRIRAVRFRPAFLVDTLLSARQAKRAEGYLDGRMVADRRQTYWTMTAWTDAAAMRASMTAGPHRRAWPPITPLYTREMRTLSSWKSIATANPISRGGRVRRFHSRRRYLVVSGTARRSAPYDRNACRGGITARGYAYPCRRRFQCGWHQAP